MTSTGHRTDRDHPITAAVSEIEAALTEVEHAPAWSLSDDETRRNLVALTRLSARVAALELKVAAHADRNQVGESSAATSAAVWWANQTRMTQREAARKMKLAKALETHDPVGDALAAGDVLADQAAVITDAVDALPDTIQPGSAPRPAITSSTPRGTSTPGRCGSRAGGSSTSSPPRSGRPRRPDSSPGRSVRPRQRPG
jgi:cobalamin biosynthesis Mg chelatase CobN